MASHPATLGEAMPALLRHAGVWQGTYRIVDLEGRTLDFHHSTIEVRCPADGPYAYLQRNHFVWPDGRELRVEHPGVYRDGLLVWDTPHIAGHAWQGDARTCILTWRRKDQPDSHLYELIVLADTGLTRARTWHWFRAGRLYQRTLIEEERVGD